MALVKNSRGGDGRNSSNYCSTVPVAVFVAFCLVGIWIAMSSIVPLQDSVMEVSETINEVKNIANQTGSRQYEDKIGDTPNESAMRDNLTPISQSENRSESAETEKLDGQNDNNQLRGSSETLDESKSDKSLDDSKLGTENSVSEVSQQDEGETKKEEIKENLQTNTQDSTGESNMESLENSKDETLIEAGTKNGTWLTQDSESQHDKDSQKSSISIDSSKYDWKLCNTTSGSEYIPCLDNLKAIKKLQSISHYEHRERHCPDEVSTCLVSLPEGYRSPIRWPKSREMIWYNNAPHTKLVESKGHQNWIKVSGEYLSFPGGGTQFKHGALHYIELIEKSLPNIAWGKRSRVILDVGCGVASFGGYLFEKDVLTMSFAPKDVHEAQVQFALERGIPATLGVMGTKRLPFPGSVFDLIHCARCRVPWHIEGGKLLLELNRVLRPGGYFVWSATPVYQKDPESVGIWKDMQSMSFVPARTGRQRQRYEDNLRLVSGCIPYRWRKENADQNGETEEIVEVLMVSSPKRDDLVFPKGGWEDDETVTEAACREALEEAGVKGRLRETPLGIWEFRSKSSQDLCSMEGGCRGYMFALEVTEELEAWPEQKNRARQWLTIKEAIRLSRYDWMCNALKEFTRVMEEDTKLEKQDMNVDVDPPSVLVTDVSECYKRSSNKQHHANLLQRASPEIAIHFSY